MQEFAERINLSIPIANAIEQLSNSFTLGKVDNFSPLPIGYHDLKVAFTTNKDNFVAKFFGKETPFKRIDDIAQVMLACQNLPIEQIQQTKDGPIFELKGSNGITYIIVSEYFAGHDFHQSPPTDTDYKNLSQLLAQIHKIDLKIDRFYDDWGPARLNNEFTRTSCYPDNDIVPIIEDIQKQLKSLSSTNFHKSIIYGDLHRSNILKNAKNQYCLIDFGCIDYNWSILDLASFLAWFCFDGISNSSNIQNIYSIVLNEYIKHISLHQEEIKSIPILICAYYAAYYLATSELLAKGDSSQATKTWHQQSHSALMHNKEICQLNYS